MSFETQQLRTDMSYKQQIHNLVGADQSFRTERLGESLSLQ
jgi:hypothetical protein